MAHDTNGDGTRGVNRLALAFFFALFAMGTISSSARGAIIPRIVPTELVPAANTLSFTVSNVGQVIGPLFAGFLVTRPHGFEYAYALHGEEQTSERGGVLEAAGTSD